MRQFWDLPAADSDNAGMHPPLLVVEDDETIRETIRDVLVLEGFSVTACGNGKEALRTLQECPPGDEFSSWCSI